MLMKITFCGWKRISTKPLVRRATKATAVVQYHRMAAVLASFQIYNFTDIAVLPLRMDLRLLNFKNRPSYIYIYIYIYI
jgi:hypothetical protein